jgi:hypothetical protein
LSVFECFDTSPSAGLRELDEKKGYWTGAVEIVDLDLARVAEAVRRALAARARRKAAS